MKKFLQVLMAPSNRIIALCLVLCIFGLGALSHSLIPKRSVDPDNNSYEGRHSDIRKKETIDPNIRNVMYSTSVYDTKYHSNIKRNEAKQALISDSSGYENNALNSDSWEKFNISEEEILRYSERTAWKYLGTDDMADIEETAARIEWERSSYVENTRPEHEIFLPEVKALRKPPRRTSIYFGSPNKWMGKIEPTDTNYVHVVMVTYFDQTSNQKIKKIKNGKIKFNE